MVKASLLPIHNPGKLPGLLPASLKLPSPKMSLPSSSVPSCHPLLSLIKKRLLHIGYGLYPANGNLFCYPCNLIGLSKLRNCMGIYISNNNSDRQQQQKISTITICNRKKYPIRLLTPFAKTLNINRQIF
jgi:hypothetical protein